MSAAGGKNRAMGRQLKRNQTHVRYNTKRGYVSKSNVRRTGQRWIPRDKSRVVIHVQKPKERKFSWGEYLENIYAHVFGERKP